MNNLHNFKVLHEKSSVEDIRTWIDAWELCRKMDICTISDALAYLDDSVLVRYGKWLVDTNPDEDNTFETLNTFLQSQMGPGMTETGAALELMSFPATGDIRHFNDTFLRLAQQAAVDKLQFAVGLYAKRMPLTLCKLIMACPTQPSLRKAMDLVRIRVETVQAMHRNADLTPIITAALKDLGPFAGPQTAKQ
ncbi:hypothetical protein H4R20_001850 [Coemansia guatemalensis]|uniref:Uncharacterized protein n=1 Tax=Coemansia guatemalensis TaxID=2761395 RepID=A0A9W8LUK0_9FUNG|nr:hypothetical protein H4R20_001850 [Coemansia guatemalensis]